jgi:hypothetical protein
MLYHSLSCCHFSYPRVIHSAYFCQQDEAPFIVSLRILNLFASGNQQARLKEENRISDISHAMLGVLLKKTIPDSTQIDLI